MLLPGVAGIQVALAPVERNDLALSGQRTGPMEVSGQEALGTRNPLSAVTAQLGQRRWITSSREAACWAPSWMTQHPGAVPGVGQRVPTGSSPDLEHQLGLWLRGEPPRLQFVAVGLWSQGPGCLRAQRAH